MIYQLDINSVSLPEQEIRKRRTAVRTTRNWRLINREMSLRRFIRKETDSLDGATPTVARERAICCNVAAFMFKQVGCTWVRYESELGTVPSTRTKQVLLWWGSRNKEWVVGERKLPGFRENSQPWKGLAMFSSSLRTTVATTLSAGAVVINGCSLLFYCDQFFIAQFDTFLNLQKVKLAKLMVCCTICTYLGISPKTLIFRH